MNGFGDGIGDAIRTLFVLIIVVAAMLIGAAFGIGYFIGAR